MYITEGLIINTCLDHQAWGTYSRGLAWWIGDETLCHGATCTGWTCMEIFRLQSSLYTIVNTKKTNQLFWLFFFRKSISFAWCLRCIWKWKVCQNFWTVFL